MDQLSPTRSFAAGQHIFRDGEKGEEMFFVKCGTVQIVMSGMVAETLSQGEFFGEMALIDQQPRSADAIAVTDCELEALTEGQFLVRVQRAPFFALRVMRAMAPRLRAANQNLHRAGI